MKMQERVTRIHHNKMKREDNPNAIQKLLQIRE